MQPDRQAAGARLGQVQRWMQSCLMHPGTAEEAVASRTAEKEFPASEAPGLIRPSRTLAPLERLNIYRGMYELRLIGALRIDYPGLDHLLGSETFDELCQLYIRECPSRSYTLNRLGDGLPDFLAQVDGLARPMFIRDLARLELAETLVFDESESETAEAAAVNGLSPEDWERLRFHPIAALRLVALDYPAHLYLKAMRAETEPPPIRRRKARLAVYRRDYGIRHMELTGPAYELLSALMTGFPLGEALEQATAGTRVAEKEITGWFQMWFEAGLFERVAIEPVR